MCKVSKRRLVALATLAFGLTSLSACCDCPPASRLVTFEFEGEFANVGDALGVLGGLSGPIPFRGWYSFDPATPDEEAEPENGTYDSRLGGSGMFVTFDTFAISTPAVGPTLRITTSDEPASNPADVYAVRTGNLVGAGGFPSGWVFQVLVDVAKGSPSDLLTSAVLPRTPPDLSLAGVNATFQIVGGPSPQTVGALSLLASPFTLTLR